MENQTALEARATTKRANPKLIKPEANLSKNHLPRHRPAGPRRAEASVGE